MANVEDYLKSKGIDFIRHKHPAVFTVEQAREHCGHIPGIASKNLFLRDGKGTRYFLVILPADKRADLKKIGTLLGAKQVRFASPEALKEKLGLEAGSVSPFGLVNDHNHEVETCIDNEIYRAAIVSFHPNRNTATLELSGEMFRKYLGLTGNKFQALDL